MADTSTNTQLQVYLEELVHMKNGSLADGTAFAGSVYEQQILNKGYLKAAYRYNWPQTLKRFADVVVANVDRYTLQTDFRKFIFMRQQGMPLTPTDIEHIITGSFGEYATALDSLEYVLANLPTTASTAYTFSGSYSAGSAIVVTLNSVNGISAGDEIFISDTTSSEFTKVQSVDSTLVTITVKLKNAHNNKTLYRVSELNYFQYQFQVTPLSAGSDVPVIPGETHLVIPHYGAYLYYKDIEEPDRADMHLQTFNDEIDEAWLAWGKTEAGAAGQFTL